MSASSYSSFPPSSHRAVPPRVPPPAGAVLTAPPLLTSASSLYAPPPRYSTTTWSTYAGESASYLDTHSHLHLHLSTPNPTPLLRWRSLPLQVTRWHLPHHRAPPPPPPLTLPYLPNARASISSPPPRPNGRACSFLPSTWILNFHLPLLHLPTYHRNPSY